MTKEYIFQWILTHSKTKEELDIWFAYKGTSG